MAKTTLRDTFWCTWYYKRLRNGVDKKVFDLICTVGLRRPSLHHSFAVNIIIIITTTTITIIIAMYRYVTKVIPSQ